MTRKFLSSTWSQLLDPESSCSKRTVAESLH